MVDQNGKQILLTPSMVKGSDIGAILDICFNLYLLAMLASSLLGTYLCESDIKLYHPSIHAGTVQNNPKEKHCSRYKKNTVQDIRKTLFKI